MVLKTWSFSRVFTMVEPVPLNGVGAAELNGRNWGRIGASSSETAMRCLAFASSVYRPGRERTCVLGELAGVGASISAETKGGYRDRGLERGRALQEGPLRSGLEAVPTLKCARLNRRSKIRGGAFALD